MFCKKHNRWYEMVSDNGYITTYRCPNCNIEKVKWRKK